MGYSFWRLVPVGHGFGGMWPTSSPANLRTPERS